MWGKELLGENLWGFEICTVQNVVGNTFIAGKLLGVFNFGGQNLAVNNLYFDRIRGPHYALFGGELNVSF